MVMPVPASPQNSGLTPYPNKPPGPVNAPKDPVQVETNTGPVFDPNKPPAPENEPKDPRDFLDRQWAQELLAQSSTEVAPNETDFPDIPSQLSSETNSPTLSLDEDLFD